MTVIIATAESEAQARLAARVKGAGYAIGAVVGDEAKLRQALEVSPPDCWVVVGGKGPSLLSFVAIANQLGHPVVIFAEEGAEEALRDFQLLHRGAVLASSAPDAALQAAVAAVREGLQVFTPGLPLPSVAHRQKLQPLSAREREILALAATGASTKAIARELELSPNTVKFHLHAAFDKLGASTRTEAVVRAMRRGELSI